MFKALVSYTIPQVVVSQRLRVGYMICFASLWFAMFPSLTFFFYLAQILSNPNKCSLFRSIFFAGRGFCTNIRLHLNK